MKLYGFIPVKIYIALNFSVILRSETTKNLYSVKILRFAQNDILFLM